VTVTFSVIYAECHIQALNAECHYAECRYAECRYAECRGAKIYHTGVPSLQAFISCTFCVRLMINALAYLCVVTIEMKEMNWFQN
jgi:hypothetical protein